MGSKMIVTLPGFTSLKTFYEDVFTPLESPAIYGGDAIENLNSLLKVGFKALPFPTGFTCKSRNLT
jgi:hypothetical protein